MRRSTSRRRAARRTRREVLLLGAGALAAGVFAACFGGDDDEQAGPGAPAGRTIPLLSSQPGDRGAQGGLLRMGAVRGEGLTRALRPLIYSRLVAVDPRTALIHADLAESIELLDGLEVVFTLRPDLRFHADAEGLAAAVTAEPVRRDFQSRADAGEQLFTEVVDRVEAPDQRTVVLHLHGPFSLLFDFLGDPALASVRSSERYVAIDATLGGGPFIPASREPEGDLLARNQLYHRAGLPLLDHISVMVVDDERELAAAFEDGALDVLVPVNGAGEPGAGPRESARPGVVVLERPSFGVVGLGLSLLPEKDGRSVRFVEAFQEPRVRRALSLALDREAIIEQFGGVPSGPVGPAHAADALSGDELASHPLSRHDPAEARRLLEAAGHSGLEFRLQSPDRPRLRALAQLVEGQLVEAGFAPTAQLMEEQSWGRGFRTGDFEATLFELDDLSTPDRGLRLHTSAGGVDGRFSLWGYSNPVYDAAVRDVLSELEPARRAERARQAQRLLLDDVPAMFPLFTPLEQVWVAQPVRGFAFDGYGFNAAWLAAQWSLAGDAAG